MTCSRLVLTLAAAWLVLASGCQPVVPEATPVATGAQPEAAGAERVERGRELAVLGNCAASSPHAAARLCRRGAAAHAFGVAYAATHAGRRDWPGPLNADDFWKALHHGRSRDDRPLVPASRTRPTRM
jgi:hypothetical protein